MEDVRRKRLDDLRALAEQLGGDAARDGEAPADEPGAAPLADGFGWLRRMLIGVALLGAAFGIGRHLATCGIGSCPGAPPVAETVATSVPETGAESTADSVAAPRAARDRGAAPDPDGDRDAATDAAARDVGGPRAPEDDGSVARAPRASTAGRLYDGPPPAPASGGEPGRRPPYAAAAPPGSVRDGARGDAPRRAATPPARRPAPEPPRVYAVPSVPRSDQVAAAASRRVDLTGRWELTNAIDATTHRAFAGLRIRFDLRLEQRGDRLVGRGEKRAVNGRPLPSSQRTPIVLEGAVDGRDVVVRFVEHGTRRTSTGAFRWRLSADGELRGRFDSTAAGTHGRSYGRRVG